MSCGHTRTNVQLAQREMWQGKPGDHQAQSIKVPNRNRDVEENQDMELPEKLGKLHEWPIPNSTLCQMT